MFKHAAASLTGRAPNAQSGLHLSSLHYVAVFCDVFALNAIVLSKRRLAIEISSCTLQGIITVNFHSGDPDKHMKSNRVLQQSQIIIPLLGTARARMFLSNRMSTRKFFNRANILRDEKLLFIDDS
jgi:hypothetical protein